MTKRLKLNKKTLTISITIIFILIATFLFYILFIKKNPKQSWYDSNWSYRRSLYIEDIGREYQGFQEDVLIQLDTKVFIEEKKLQNNCQDIRFVDPDTNTNLPYWIEGGCNTEETQIWISVNLPNAFNKTVYMYYGNEKAPDKQESWEGNFITMSLDGCNGNWSSEKDFSGRFILATETFGYTGGSETHSHELFSYSEGNCTDPVHVGLSSNDRNCNPNNENIILSTTSQFSNIPDYTNTNFCSSRDGYLGKNSIIFLNKNNTSETLEHVSIFDNKYPRGEDSQKIDTVINHIHTLSCINTPLALSNRAIKYLSLEEDTNTIVTQTEPSYYIMNFVTKTSGGGIPTNSIMMVSSIPPLGWEYFKDAENRLIKGSSGDFGSTGGEESHHHVFNADISTRSTSEDNLVNINTKNICLLENFTESLTTTEDVSLPPYTTTILAQKKDGLIGIIKTSWGIEEEGAVLGTTGSGPSQPTELKTEGETNPESVIDSTPEFTAKFNHPDYP